MLFNTLLALLPCIPAVTAAISIINPTANTIWYANDTVSLNWTLSDPTTDTYLFRTYLSNQDQSLLAGNTSIADSTNATAAFVKILLPRITAGDGYIINFVNTSNEQQVYATTPSFTIEQGETRNMTSASASMSSTSALGIPGAASSTSDRGFPSASSSAPNAGQMTAGISLGPLVQAGVVFVAALAGVGLIF